MVAGATKTGTTGCVWDWPTRVVHWALAVTVPASWITANAFDLLAVHMVIGYVTLGLVVFRVVWGFVGPYHARFANFVRGPKVVLAYATTLLRRDTAQATGHNPLGALAVVLMLAMLAFQAVSGLFATDELFHFGPYNGVVSQELAKEITSLHKTNGDLLLWVAGLHVLAIGFYLYYKRQNLLWPMVSGDKTLPERPNVVFVFSQRTRLALVLAVVILFAVYALVTLAPPPPPADDMYF